MPKRVATLSKYITIFSYGTLWEDDVQLRQFGTTFETSMDLDYLVGYDIGFIEINGKNYKVLTKTSGKSMIAGVLVKIPKSLIRKVDEYEGKSYKRVKETTVSGVACEVYIKRN